MMPVTQRAAALYACFFIGCIVVYKTLQARATGQYDYILTASAAMQTLAFALLVSDTRSNVGEGLSEKTLFAFCLAHATRLSTTFIGDGYIPEDNTADVYLYQLLELSGVLLVGYKVMKLNEMRKIHDVGRGLERWSQLLGMAALSLVLGFFTKSTGHNHFLMDLLWMFSVWLEAMALFPQVWLLFSTTAAYVDETMVHFAGLTLAAGVTFGSFWGRIAKDRFLERQEGEHSFWIAIIVAAAMRVVLCSMYFVLFMRSARELKGVVGSSGKGEYELCKTDDVVDMDEL